MSSLHLSPTKYFLSFPLYKRKFLSNWKYFYIACWNTFYEEKSNKMKIYSNIYSKSDKKIYRKYCCRNQPKNCNCFHQLITNFIDWHNSRNVSKAHDNWTRTNDVWFVLQKHPDGTAIDFIFVENIHHSDCLYALRANMFNDIFRCESSQLENPMS